MNVTRIRSRRNNKGARLALSALLTVSMLFGSVPNGALQALAEEAEIQDAVVVEEAYIDSDISELLEDVAGPEDTLLEAEADGMRAQLAVKAGVELPEGSRLVVTSLSGAVRQAAIEASNAAKIDTREQGSSAGAPVAELMAKTAEERAVTGAQVALSGMSNAVDSFLAEREAEVTDEAVQTVVSAAYAIEVIDGEGNLVSLGEDDATLTITLPKEAAEGARGVYAITRSEAEPEDGFQVTEAMGAPVATVAEEKYENEDAAAESVVFAGKAKDVTGDVLVDEGTGTVSLLAAGDPSVVVTAEGPLRAPVNAPSGQDTNRVSLKDEGFTLNLFNYFAIENVNHDTYYPDNVVDHVRYEGINSEDGTESTAHLFQFYNGGTSGNGYNWYTGGSATPMQGIVQNELVPDASGEHYYPVLAYPDANGTSLAYLFDETIPSNQTYNGRTIYPKQRYGNVDGLFEQDEHGYYSYDSNKNYAYYDTSQGDNGNFYIHSDTYARGNAPTSDYKIGFFPFNQWTSSSNNLVSPGNKDHHFGLTMGGTFTIPETSDGMAEHTNPNTGELERNPVKFEMGGDDDMLVFIDGVLVLDLGGIHQPVHGSIDFTNGTVDIYGDPLNGRWAGTENPIKVANDTVGAKTMDYDIVTKRVIDNGVDYGDKPVYTANLNDFFQLVNREWDGTPGSSHRIDVFYLERGSYDSNLLVRFNLPLTPTTDLTVKKEWYAHDRKENDHSDSMMVQLYQQIKNPDGTYTDPRPYGNPVELKASDYEYTFTDLPVHSHLETDHYYYTVKEGVVINGQFIAADNGESISDGYVYGLDTITYEYEGDSTGSLTEVYPTKEDAAFHNGNNTPKVGTATIANKREGQITVEKRWLNSSGEPDEADHSSDEVAVQLVKLTKSPQDETFDNATEEVIDVITLNADGKWRGAFDDDAIVKGNPNVEYVVYEGYMNGDSFVRSNIISTTSSGEYELDSTRYLRTTISESSGDIEVMVDQDSPEHVAQNTRELYWWIDVYQNRYWLNRTYGHQATELAMENGSEPQLLQDTVTQQLIIPYSAMLIPDDSATYDFVVDVSFAESQGLNLTGLSIGYGLEGSGASIATSGAGYQLRVPAAWAKAHAGEVFTINIGVSASQTLQNVAGINNRAHLRVVPTSYIVTGMSGHSAPVQDTWESEEGLQLVEGGTGHAILANKPYVAADVTIMKTDAKTGDELEGAKFVVYENTGSDTYDVTDDTRPSKRFPDAETEFISGSNGTVEITDLVPGIYWIVETSAPEGYLVMGPDNPIGVMVDAEGNVSLVGKDGNPIADPNESTEPSISTENNTVILTVPNARAYSLPAAGGPGAYPFLFAGAFVAAFALASEDNKRRLLGLFSAGARR